MLKKIIIILLMLISISKISKMSFAKSPANFTEIADNIFASNLSNYKHIGSFWRNSQEITKFQVAKSETDQQKTIGLMHLKTLPKNYAMLFIWQEPQKINMWMKNTHLKLDMIFFDENYQIVKIHSMAKPLSLEIISSEKKAKAVLEINGGLAKKLQLKLGDKFIL